MSAARMTVSAPSEIAVDVDPPKATVSVFMKLPPNGGYGWAVVFAAFLISFVTVGSTTLLEVVRIANFEGFLDDLPLETSWMPYWIECVSLITSPIAGVLMRVYGFKLSVFMGGLLCFSGLTLGYFATSANVLGGILVVFIGMGSSLAVTSSVVCASGYFSSKKQAALALALSGGSAGNLALPIVMHAIFLSLGLHKTFLVLSCVFAAICFCSFVFSIPQTHFVWEIVKVDVDEYLNTSDVKSDESEPGALVRFLKTQQEKLALKYLANPAFLLTTASVCVAEFGNHLLFHYIPLHAAVLGIEESSYVDLLTYATVGDLVARLFYGLLFCKYQLSSSTEYAVALSAFASSVILLPFCTNYMHLVALAVVAGIGKGTWSTLLPIVLDSNHGEQELSGTFALSRFFEGITGLFYPYAQQKLHAKFGAEAGLLFVRNFASAVASLGILLSIVDFYRSRKNPDASDC